MRVALDVLRRSVDLPESPADVRRLLDEQGLEVKRIEGSERTTVFTLELLANRGDHHCYEGVARELDGRLGVGVRMPPVAVLDVGESPWPLRCETDLCLVYTATLLERGEARPLGPEAQRTLDAAAIHSLSAAVDASNVANLELGQPTHAFDADTLEGPVTIRLSRAGERALPLFHEEPIELPEGTLVIADDAKILAIAGVIGCEESKTTDATTRLLLESATFDPVAVRKASRALRLHTDSSARFERGADPERPLVGAGRVVELLERDAGWRRVGPTGMVGAWRNPERIISLKASSATAFLDVDLPASEVAGRLNRYGFRVRPDADDPDLLHALVPSWRLWDVEYVADLYEELAKSVGYDTTPATLPPVGLGAVPSQAEARRERVEEVLLGLGFYEVFTDGFYGRSALEQLGVEPHDPLVRHVETLNALDRGYSLLKNNCLHQAIEAVAVNERRRTPDIKLYEWTRTFHPVDGPLPEVPDPARPPCTEQRVLWLAVSGRDRHATWADKGRPADVWFLKGLLDELGSELGLDFEVAPGTRHALSPYLHPGRQAAVVLLGEVVGVLGEVHPQVCRRYRIKQGRPVYLQLDEAALASPGARPLYQEPPTTQDLVRSLAFSLPHGVKAGDVAAWLHASGPDWLERVAIIDLFEHDDGPGRTLRSVTFELTYANRDNTRTADEVNDASEALVRAVQEQFGPRGVSQR